MSPSKFIALATILIVCFASTALTVPLNQHGDKAITELSTTEKPCGFLCKLNRTKHKLLNSTKTAVDDAKKSIKDIETKIKVFLDDKVAAPVKEIIDKNFKPDNQKKNQQTNDASTTAGGASKTISKPAIVHAVSNSTFADDLVEVFNSTRAAESDVNYTEKTLDRPYQLGDAVADNTGTVTQTKHDVPRGETVESHSGSSAAEKIKPVPGQHYPGCDCTGDSGVTVQSTDNSPSSIASDVEMFDSATDYSNVFVEQQDATEQVAVTDNYSPYVTNVTDSELYVSILNDLLSKINVTDVEKFSAALDNVSAEPNTFVTDELLTDTAHSTPIRRNATADVQVVSDTAKDTFSQQTTDSVSVVNTVQPEYGSTDAPITSLTPVVASQNSNQIDNEASTTSPDSIVFPKEQRPANWPAGNAGIGSGTESYGFAGKESVDISNYDTPYYNGARYNTNYGDYLSQPWNFGDFNTYYNKREYEGNNRSRIANLPAYFGAFNTYRDEGQNAKNNDRNGYFPSPFNLGGYGSYYGGENGNFPSHFGGFDGRINNVPPYTSGLDAYRNRNYHTATIGKVNHLASYISGFNPYQNGADGTANSGNIDNLPQLSGYNERYDGTDDIVGNPGISSSASNY